MKHPEHAIQVAFFRMVDTDARTKHLPIFAVPNYAFLTPRAGKWLKDEGKRAGVPDVLCCVPTRSKDGEAYGLAIEFKTPTGTVSAAQKAWGVLLTSHGWSVVVCRSAQEGWDALLTYGFTLEPPLGTKLDAKE